MRVALGVGDASSCIGGGGVGGGGSSGSSRVVSIVGIEWSCLSCLRGGVYSSCSCCCCCIGVGGGVVVSVGIEI